MANGRSFQRPLLPGKTPTISVPKTGTEWEKLMRETIARAESQNDRRIHGLRKALVDGKAERTLRMMGVIHSGDLPRVFPVKG